MKTIHYAMIPILAFAIGGSALAQKKFKRVQAVSIVFTAKNANNTIDTLIPAGDESLALLLNSQGLSEDKVHMIRLDEMLAGLPEGEKEEIIMIETESEHSDGSEPIRVELIRVNGEDVKREDLSEEQLELIESHKKRRIDVEAEEESNGQAQTKRIEIKKDGDGASDEEIDIRIEEKMENGEVKKVVWVNDEPVSEAQANKLIEKHNIQVYDKGNSEQEMVFIKDEGDEKSKEIRIEKHMSMDHSGTPKEAIVIVKPTQEPEKAVSALGLSTSLQLYPNPTKDKVQMKFEPALDGDYSIQITSLDGKVVRQINTSARKAKFADLDLSGLQPGTYVVSVSMEEGILSKKLIIE